MHVGGITVDLNWFLQLILTLFVIAFGLLHLVKNTASKYFEVDANFEGSSDRNRRRTAMPPPVPMAESADDPSCVVCGSPGEKQCSRCKSVRYCSPECQKSHWHSGHKTKCKDHAKEMAAKSDFGVKVSAVGGKSFSGIALIPARGISKVLFPYDEFVKLFNWDKPGFAPCGLLNCGNSCFANVVLQCLAYTRPLVAYLLEKGHRRECRRDDWCFLCEFQTHVEKASQSMHPFSPMSILSRLPNIGGNLGYGRQEDAHELMRFAIDTMQSICLDEFGGEKLLIPALKRQRLFNIYLVATFSPSFTLDGLGIPRFVICTNCDNVSNQYENMMDLTVEIHGDAASLEECLEQFTAKEWLHGDNMYKCDGYDCFSFFSYAMTMSRHGNVLHETGSECSHYCLKKISGLSHTRFSGRFGKLNKRVSFPATLDLSPYMSEEGDGSDVYKLYAVVVHVDMLNASFFGHYICYIQDFRGNWYRIDDCKVTSVEMEEVLSQGAYMLLYSRVSARPSSLTTSELSKEHNAVVEVEPGSKEVECFSTAESINPIITGSGSLLPGDDSHLRVSHEENESSTVTEQFEDTKNVGNIVTVGSTSKALREDPEDTDMVNTQPSSSDEKDRPLCNGKSCLANIPESVREGAEDTIMADSDTYLSISKELSPRDSNSHVGISSETVINDPEDMNKFNCSSSSFVLKDTSNKICNGTCCHPRDTSSAGTHSSWKQESPFNGAKSAGNQDDEDR
ncbi:hypothetical protein JRO89_XS03G0236600 [Xanthoceras sorbifolium]|uniref:Uncharacterized protein n=1 Tax=Xanthoceras sorbifolium TaxID=99658 RepID=A0ABQ8IBY4_9ROSI|nr:hypothetical protein JRO89_XS03G0236600 [Xanthoceras sorbifolium]